jgi:pimeloyl-ACP methyl ester carboxylesterase
MQLRSDGVVMNQNIRFCTTADGVKLAYAVSGEGPPLVMSATWLSHLDHQWHSASWRPWLEVFSTGHKLLRYDARGCGLSDWTADDLSFEAWVRDFECVIEAASFARFDLLAKCWGGPIAIEYAARHPERVHRLVSQVLGRPNCHRIRGEAPGTGSPSRPLWH